MSTNSKSIKTLLSMIAAPPATAAILALFSGTSTPSLADVTLQLQQEASSPFVIDLALENIDEQDLLKSIQSSLSQENKWVIVSNCSASPYLSLLISDFLAEPREFSTGARLILLSRPDAQLPRALSNSCTVFNFSFGVLAKDSVSAIKGTYEEWATQPTPSPSFSFVGSPSQSMYGILESTVVSSDNSVVSTPRNQKVRRVQLKRTESNCYDFSQSSVLSNGGDQKNTTVSAKATRTVRTSESFRSAAFFDDHRIALAGDSGQVHFLHTQTREGFAFKAHEGAIAEIDFSLAHRNDGGRFLTTGKGDNTVKCWSLRTNSIPLKIDEFSPSSNSLVVSGRFSNNGDAIVVASEHALEIHPLAMETTDLVIPSSLSFINALTSTATVSDSCFLVGDNSGSLHLVDFATMRTVESWEQQSQGCAISALASNSQGTTFWAAAKSNVNSWDCRDTEQPSNTLSFHEPVAAIALHGHSMAIGLASGLLTVFDTRYLRKPLSRCNHDADPNTTITTLCMKGDSMCSASSSGITKLWSL